MQEYNKDNFLTQWILNDKYFDMLSLLGSLSGLFSDNTIPYLNYRITENIFCKYYGQQMTQETAPRTMQDLQI